MKIKLEYWLPGMIVGLAAPGSQLTSEINLKPD